MAEVALLPTMQSSSTTPLEAPPTTLPAPPEIHPKLSNALTPPASEESNKDQLSQASDLSELDMQDDLADDEDDDDTEIEPDHYYEGGRIPVFKPTMDQFRSFKKFVHKIDKYGMKSGIVKVIPPKEWQDSLPALDEAVKTIKVKNPITQEFSGTHGTYTQANIEKQRSYNLPQWKALTEESQHQPPARRGERRKNQDKPARPSAPRAPRAAAPKPAPNASTQGTRRRPGRPRKGRGTTSKTEEPFEQGPEEDTPEEPQIKDEELAGEDKDEEIEFKGPPTPTSPQVDPVEPMPSTEIAPSGGPAHRIKQESSAARKKSPGPRAKGRQPKTVAERRKYNRAETTDFIDEAAFEGFDYRFHPAEDEFTSERCAELEALYWRTLTFAAPMYGADMPGSLFDESTTSWNVAKLENLLDVLGQKVPGVNTAYLYLGMWKATFAWHLEDVDLYSINYIHFGAPKQWYSISQEDARRFENAMKNVWPNDAKNCSQFLRHKTYLISPHLLQSQYNIKVNKLVHYEGEFVITFPYGYHSGYNLGYNCAESVNFATEQWLEFGRIAKKCDCEADSVWVDVGEIERKLRGEPTPEYYEYTDDEDLDGAEHLPSPPPSVADKSGSKKRKRGAADASQGKKKVKKIKIRIRNRSAEPCALCPNESPAEPLLPTDNGRKAHTICALYTPETYITGQDASEMICGVANIDKARLDLKCSFCRSKKGACFQCSSRKCTRAYHATCAAPAGVQVDFGPTAVYGEDGTEYVSSCFDFRCRFHRPKRPKNATAESLESNSIIRKYAKTLQPRDLAQVQYLNGDIFAGTLVENRHSERTLILDVLPDGDRIEVEYKWVLAVDPAESQIKKPSPDAQPLPAHLSMQIPPDRNAEFGPPQEGDSFNDPEAPQKWSEFNTAPAPHNIYQVKIDFETPNHLWYYLGKDSTEAKPKYTEDPSVPRHNPASLPPKEPSQSQSGQSGHSGSAKRTSNNQHPKGANYHALNGAMAASKQSKQLQAPRSSGNEKPYAYKPKLSPLNGADSTSNATGLGNFAIVEESPAADRQILTQQRSETSPAGMNQVSGQKKPTPFLFKNPYEAPSKDTTPIEPPKEASLESEGPGRKSSQGPEMQESHSQRQQHAATLLALAGGHVSSQGYANPARESSTGLSKEHAQLMAKFPYLRQSFCRRDAQYVSPYPTGGGFSQPYATFLPQSRPGSHRRPSSAEFYVERPVASPFAFAPAYDATDRNKRGGQVRQIQQQFMQQRSENMSKPETTVEDEGSTPAVGMNLETEQKPVLAISHQSDMQAENLITPMAPSEQSVDNKSPSAQKASTATGQLEPSTIVETER